MVVTDEEGEEDEEVIWFEVEVLDLEEFFGGVGGKDATTDFELKEETSLSGADKGRESLTTAGFFGGKDKCLVSSLKLLDPDDVENLLRSKLVDSSSPLSLY